MGDDRARQIHRELVHELLNWRDAQRELKALIKARYRQWGVLRVEGTGVFSRTQRQRYLDQLPGAEERRMLLRVYAQHDHAIDQWKDTLREVHRIGRQFPEIARFKKIPGIGVVGANVFSAIIEDPARFATRQKLIKYARLAITGRSSPRRTRRGWQAPGLSTARTARPPRAQDPELSRLAHRLQKHHGR